MNKLLDYSSLYEYDSTGTIPGTQADVEQTKPYDVSDAGTVNPMESIDTEGNNKTDQGILYSLSFSLLNFLISSQNSWGIHKKKFKKILGGM